MRELADLREDVRHQALLIENLMARLTALENLLDNILGSDTGPTLEEQFQANRRERMSRQQSKDRIEYMSRMG